MWERDEEAEKTLMARKLQKQKTRLMFDLISIKDEDEEVCKRLLGLLVLFRRLSRGYIIRSLGLLGLSRLMCVSISAKDSN